MYHEKTASQISEGRRFVAFIVGVLVAFLLVSALVWVGARALTREQGAQAVRTSILNSAKQCCAIEGCYPTTLEHLESGYGLAINHSDYVITYEYLGDNVMPSVVVKCK